MEDDMTDRIELSIGDFTTFKVDRLSDGGIHMTPMHSSAFAELLERGWQVIYKGKENGRLTVILRRPGKPS